MSRNALTKKQKTKQLYTFLIQVFFSFTKGACSHCKTHQHNLHLYLYNHLWFGWNKSSIRWVRCGNIPALSTVLIHCWSAVWLCVALSRLSCPLPAKSCHPQGHSPDWSRCKSPLYWILCCQNDFSPSWRLCSVPVWCLLSRQAAKSTWAESQCCA